jgi:hypothetical protein
MRPKLFCSINYEPGHARSKNLVARFYRCRDSVQVGAATWLKKERKFIDVRGIGRNALLQSEADAFAASVPVLKVNGIWYSNK